jgi:glycerophosphoryl diester phosphodiesterase
MVSLRGLRLIGALGWMLAVPTAHAFDLQGHRGARGLFPENTLAGFSAALAIGVSTLELDLGMTRDDILVVSHDSELNPNHTRGPDGRFLNAKGPAIRSLTLAELKRYDVGRLKPGTSYASTFREQRTVDGATMPTLDEVFDLVRKAGANHIRFNIETKLTPTSGSSVADPETFATAFVQAVRKAGLADRVAIQSFDWRTLMVAKRLAPEIERVCLTIERGDSNLRRGERGPSPWTAGLDIDDFGGSVPRLVKAAECSVWSPLFRELTPETITEARSLGLKVIPWTVNERADMERMVRSGINGLITDYPDRLREVMAAAGMALPPAVAVR